MRWSSTSGACCSVRSGVIEFSSSRASTDELVLLGDQHQTVAMTLAGVRKGHAPNLRRPRALQRSAIIEPELGDAVPWLTALVGRRAGDQAHAIFSQVGKLLAVCHVLVQPPAVESLARPACRAAQ